jgi:RNA polymerase sigma-70 factor (ECF subfamily)
MLQEHRKGQEVMQPTAKKNYDDGMPDAEIAQRVAAGDQRAFELLMRRHNQSLYRTARSIVRDDAEAEDVLQDAYLLAYRGIGKFRGDAKLATWLTRIVVNEAIARSRKSSRRADIIRLDGEARPGDDTSEMNVAESTSEQPERSALRAEARRLLERKIDELPNAFRTVFVLRAIEEMTVEEAAVCLDIPEATVRTRFFRARSLLREGLAREIDFAYEDVFSFDGARCDRIVAGVLSRITCQPSPG